MQDLEDALSSGDLHKNVSHVIECDITDPRKKAMRAFLAVLGANEGLWIEGNVLAEAAEFANATSNPRVLRRLIQLTEKYSEQYGFIVESRKRAPRVPNDYRLTITRQKFVPRKRALQTIPKGAEHIQVTDSHRRIIQRRLQLALTDHVPEERVVESLMLNSTIPRAETGELEYLQDLVDHAREGRAPRTDLFRVKNDIPESDNRWCYNLAGVLESNAVESGFVIAAIQPNYHGVFFLDPEKREQLLLKKYHGLGESLTGLDGLEPLSYVVLACRVKRIPLVNLASKTRKIIKWIARAELEGAPVTEEEVLLAFKITQGQYYYLKRVLKVNRFEFGFYLRARGDTKQQCILVDMAHANG